MLDEVVDQRYEGAEECSSEIFPQLDRPRVRRAQRKTAERPGDGRDKVRNHEDIMPIVVVRRRDIRPASARKGPEDAKECDELGKCATRACRQKVPQCNEGKSRTFGRHRNQHRKDMRKRREQSSPEVIAMKTMKTDRSGYRSPIVADTDGNHSSGYP